MTSAEPDHGILGNWYLSGNIQVTTDPSSRPTTGSILSYSAPPYASSKTTGYVSPQPDGTNDVDITVSASHKVEILSRIVTGSGRTTLVRWSQDLSFNNWQSYTRDANYLVRVHGAKRSRSRQDRQLTRTFCPVRLPSRHLLALRYLRITAFQSSRTSLSTHHLLQQYQHNPRQHYWLYGFSAIWFTRDYSHTHRFQGTRVWIIHTLAPISQIHSSLVILSPRTSMEVRTLQMSNTTISHPSRFLLHPLRLLHLQLVLGSEQMASSRQTERLQRHSGSPIFPGTLTGVM